MPSWVWLAVGICAGFLVLHIDLPKLEDMPAVKSKPDCKVSADSMRSAEMDVNVAIHGDLYRDVTVDIFASELKPLEVARQIPKRFVDTDNVYLHQVYSTTRWPLGRYGVSWKLDVGGGKVIEDLDIVEIDKVADHIIYVRCGSFSGSSDNVAPSLREPTPRIRPTELMSNSPLRPTRAPFWTKAELVQLSAFLKAAPQSVSKQIAICQQSNFKLVYDRRGAWYKARCDGKVGWIEAKYIRLLDD